MSSITLSAAKRVELAENVASFCQTLPAILLKTNSLGSSPVNGWFLIECNPLLGLEKGNDVMLSHYHQATFILSAAQPKQLPPDAGTEVAIVGRSNAGKSSVLNRLTAHKQLARVSKTPGRTQLINIFGLDADRRLMDLPGYGYAKVPEEVQAKWQKVVDHYISQRVCLKGLVLVMDIRHPLKPLDVQLLAYCQARALPVHILLNKSDKLSRLAAKNTHTKVSQFLTQYDNSVSLQCFSALKNTGIAELALVLDASM